MTTWLIAFGAVTGFTQGVSMSGDLADPGKSLPLGTSRILQSLSADRVVSIFFLISYGLLNYTTFFEARAASPSFRPRFKWFSPSLSLIGFLTCAGVMLAIDARSGAAAIAVLFAIHQYLKRTAGPARWSDSSRAYHLQQVRNHLLEAKKYPSHDRDWRPRLLIFEHGENIDETISKKP